METWLGPLLSPGEFSVFVLVEETLIVLAVTMTACVTACVFTGGTDVSDILCSNSVCRMLRMYPTM